MRINVIKSLIAIAISALLAYACYAICAYEHVRWIITIGAFLTIATPTLLTIGITAKKARSATMLSALSGVLLFVEIVANGIFAFFDFSIPVYVITNGLILLIYILIYNSIYQKQM